MLKIKNKKRKGFTLLELLVAMAVFSMMMTVLMQFFGSAQKVSKRTGDRTRDFENGRVAMELISRDLRSASFSGNSKPMTFGDGAIEFYAYSQNSKTPAKLVKVKYELVDKSLTLEVSGAQSDEVEVPSQEVVDRVQSLVFSASPQDFQSGMPDSVTIELGIGRSDDDTVMFTKTIFLGGRGQHN